MAEQKQPPAEEPNGGKRGAKIRKGWFNGLPEEKQDEVILPAFDKAPHAEKIEAKKKYGG